MVEQTANRKKQIEMKYLLIFSNIIAECKRKSSYLFAIIICLLLLPNCENNDTLENIIENRWRECEKDTFYVDFNKVIEVDWDTLFFFGNLPIDTVNSLLGYKARLCGDGETIVFAKYSKESGVNYSVYQEFFPWDFNSNFEVKRDSSRKEIIFTQHPIALEMTSLKISDVPSPIWRMRWSR